MAARSRKVVLHERWRDKIRASMLINRLTNHVLGKIEMSKTQVAAAVCLLRKVVPDISSVEYTGADGGPMEIKLVGYHDSLSLPAPALPAPDPEGAGLRH
jgi:hypothetical protein